VLQDVEVEMLVQVLPTAAKGRGHRLSTAGLGLDNLTLTVSRTLLQ
jgi:hypothetical protein